MRSGSFLRNYENLCNYEKSTTHFCAVLFVLVEITGPIQITVTLLQSMHGALPGERNSHSFGVNKKAPHISV